MYFNRWVIQLYINNIEITVSSTLKIHNQETDKVLLFKDVVKPRRILPYCRLSFFLVALIGRLWSC